ncbi:MAG TPA: VanW family protein, partial [Bacillota bacterium]|nr:VanW family protein [Bacillota bacterium]
MRRQWVAVSIAVGVIAASVLLCASGGRAPSETTPVNKATGHVLGRCITLLNADEKERNANVALGARKLDGTVIDAGTEFSFNASIGERGVEQGYKPAMVIVDGKNESGIAGGICQLSST